MFRTPARNPTEGSTPRAGSSTAMSSSGGGGGNGGGDGDHNASTPRVQFTGGEMLDHLDKLLECPVCYDVILPPIITCCQGHICCEICRRSLERCPVCRGALSNVRNLFAEQFLEKCLFVCKHGCNAVLPAKELAKHYKDGCRSRPIHCRECDQMVPYEEYLHHVEHVDKLERQKASECSTGFEIDEDDLIAYPAAMVGRRYTVWEPTWMHCYGHDFFCSLDYNGENWWIWVASLQEKGCELKCQIILWSRDLGSEHTYFGAIHPIRTETSAVLQSGKCLILTKKSLKNFMHEGGIDVLVRIESKYVVPKTRRGIDVQSPLELTGSGSSRTQRISHRASRNDRLPIQPQVDEPHTTTPNTRAGSVRHESRIPVSVHYTSPDSPVRRPQLNIAADGSRPEGAVQTARRVLFDIIPSRGVGTVGTAAGMRFRMNRGGYRHPNQVRRRSFENEDFIDLTNEE